MHPLHDYIASQLAAKIKGRRIVVMYDSRREFASFFEELLEGAPRQDCLSVAKVGPRSVKVATFDGSYLQIRFAIEAATGSDDAEDVVVYMPGVDWDDKASLLMEVEKAGVVYRPQLRQLARLVLRQRFTDVAIDDMLRSNALKYHDLARMAEDRGASEGASLLKGIFGVSDTLMILTSWLADDAHDGEIVAKDAVSELRTVVLARLGVELPSGAKQPRMRASSQRYVLANEFRAHVAGEAPPGLKSIPAPSTKDQEQCVCEIARRLRERHSASYMTIADRIEKELGLDTDVVPGDRLGSIDTFPFEEHAVVRKCFELLARENYAEARKLIAVRERGFWIDSDLARKAVWESCRMMVEIGEIGGRVRMAITKPDGKPEQWVNRYAAQDDGWFRLDRAQRRFETLVAGLDEQDLDQAALARTRTAYDEAVRQMTEGFVKALAKADWTMPGVLPQTRIWADIVATLPKPVAIVAVDAMRYEMGIDLAERVTKFGEVRLVPAIAALPTITPIGMAALLPGASASFSVSAKNGRIGALINDAFLPDLPARQRFLQAGIPSAVDVTLGEVVSFAKRTKDKLAGAQVVLVRSSEIDSAGESTESHYARAIMGGVVEQVARCLQKLASVGIENAVVTADHGHLFFATERETSMRIEAPGGDEVDLHRRCWIGRGGATPPGTVRVSGAKLGYTSDLDIVLPVSASVFKAGGDLAYHHGGASLQELVIPVLTVRTRAAVTRAEKQALSVKPGFEAVTSRIFSVEIGLGGPTGNLFQEARKIRPLAIHDNRQVAAAKMTAVGQIEDGVVTVEPGNPVNVAFLLTDDQVPALRIQVLDADTDAVLYTSPKDIPVRLGV
jgi:hypothetical protein